MQTDVERYSQDKKWFLFLAFFENAFETVLETRRLKNVLKNVTVSLHGYFGTVQETVLYTSCFENNEAFPFGAIRNCLGESFGGTQSRQFSGSPQRVFRDYSRDTLT